ncbi:MAG: putative glutamine amidotransferase [Chloroflexota bacterium]|jgi:putative glutamine amidotransferase|nr:putative glutamine amidotransferase [Chloroflexota bacterium]
MHECRAYGHNEGLRSVRPAPRHRPLVGLTTSELRRPEAATRKPQSEPPMRELALGLGYPGAIEEAGGVPVILPPLHPDAIDELVDRLDGLLLTGGPDLHPGTYGAQAHPALGPTEREIDVFELALIRAAERRGLPILAICRGMQALNVARGGTLVQDLPSEHPGALVHRQTEPGRIPTHDVRLVESCRLASIAGKTAIRVNSFHHQAVDRLGAGLRAVGWAPDGVIEVLEDPRASFVVGVQWHAESLSESEPVQAGLLAAFVDAATRWQGVEAVA